MKHKNTGKLISFFALLFLAFTKMQFVSYAGDLAKDTVWTKKTTEGSFHSLQFINNDAVIVAQASGSTVFYDVFNSKELRRLAGSNKAIFFNDENSFIRITNDKKRIEIYDTQSLELIGELENDDKLVTEIVISEDGAYAVGTLVFGLRVWDLKTKKILRTKIFETNDFLYNIDFRRLTMINGDIYAFSNKYYKDDAIQKEYTVKEIIKYSFETLDSIETWGDKGVIFRASPSGNLIAFGTNGVEIYNLATKELVSNIKVLNSLVLTEIEFSNDENFIVTSSTTGDNNIKAWDVKNGNELYQYGKAGYSALSISNNQNYILGANGRTLLLFKSYFNILSVENKFNNDTIYPNPASKRLEVRYNILNPSFFKIEITNISGQKLYSNEIGFKNTGENFESLDVSQYINGIYNIRIYSDFEMINLKFIKE